MAPVLRENHEGCKIYGLCVDFVKLIGKLSPVLRENHGAFSEKQLLFFHLIESPVLWENRGVFRNN